MAIGRQSHGAPRHLALADGSLAAPGLRIPVSQIAGLARKGLLVRGDDVLFADALYSTELGLDLTFRSQDDS